MGYYDIEPTRSVEILGKDPPGYRGLAQLDILVQAGSYHPIWIKSYRWKRQGEKPDARTRKFYSWWRTILRDRKHPQFKKIANQLVKELYKYYKVPVKLGKRLIQARLAWIIEREKHRGIEGALNDAGKWVEKAIEDVGKGLVEVVKAVGPVVADIIPGAGPLIKQGLKVLNDAQAGIKGAVDKVKTIARGVDKGIPEALKSMDALKAARLLQKQINGEVPPAPGAVAIDKARLLKAASAKGYALLDVRNKR